MNKIILLGIPVLLIVLFSFITVAEEQPLIGYEFLDDNKTVHIWNTQDSYYFNISSGIQLTNHYQDYWTRNVFCIGYYSGEEWIKIKCADELDGFNKYIETNNVSYVNALIWKEFNYGGYDLRLGIEYHLGLDDKTLSITVYGKNLGIDIPFDLGFAWKVTDWEIPHAGTTGGDSIRINNTDYELDGTYDLSFKNMTRTYVDYIENETTGEIIGSETIVEPIPTLRGFDYGHYLTIDWNENLSYTVKMYGNGNQEDFYVVLLINAGHFNPNQEKSTTFQWIDAEWDISTAVYLQNFSIATESTSPDGFFFKPDGTKMYIVGSEDDVNEYDLSDDWNVTSASFLRNISIEAEETYSTGIFFKPDGSKMYIVGYGHEEVNEYDLDPAWDVTSAEWLQLFSIADENLDPHGLFFKPDGTKMYTVGSAIEDGVNEYDLDPAWDVTSVEWLQFFSIVDEETGPKDIFFKPDGTKMYIVGVQVDEVNEYDLDTAWDISSAEWLQLFSVTDKEGFPQGISFKPDGTKMYIMGSTGDKVYEYDLPALPDTTAPTFNETPANVTLAYSIDTLYADFNATDPSGLSFWWVNDTGRFNITQSGELKNSTLMAVQDWHIIVYVNDTLNNINSSHYLATVIPESDCITLQTNSGYVSDAGTLVIDEACDLDTDSLNIKSGGIIITSAGNLLASGCYVEDGQVLYVNDSGGLYCES